MITIVLHLHRKLLHSTALPLHFHFTSTSPHIVGLLIFSSTIFSFAKSISKTDRRSDNPFTGGFVITVIVRVVGIAGKQAMI